MFVNWLLDARDTSELWQIFQSALFACKSSSKILPYIARGGILNIFVTCLDFPAFVIPYTLCDLRWCWKTEVVFCKMRRRFLHFLPLLEKPYSIEGFASARVHLEDWCTIWKLCESIFEKFLGATLWDREKFEVIYEKTRKKGTKRFNILWRNLHLITRKNWIDIRDQAKLHFSRWGFAVQPFLQITGNFFCRPRIVSKAEWVLGRINVFRDRIA